MFRTTLAAATIAALTTTAAFAESPAKLGDPISLREHVMENVGKAAGIGGAMLKGEKPFDAGAAQAVLHVFAASALGFAALFPEGSDKGETEAKAEIWTDRAGFEKAVQKFIDDSDAAAESKPADLDAFKAAFGQVASNCKSCHEAYRVKKN